MEDDLLKQLKDAGFPLKPASMADEKARLKMFQYGKDSIGRDNTWWLIPTLSELIDACGEDFAELVRSNDYETKPMWRAYMTEEAFDKTGIDCVVDCDGYEIGETPEIAVANLWLALNKK